MDPKTQSAPNRVYEDYEPSFEWKRNQRSATLIVVLPGFGREQLKVQVTSTPVLRINGERQLSGQKWRRISKEFSIPSDCDANEVSAKFESGLLYVKFPIVTTQKPQEAPKPQPQAPIPKVEGAPPKPREEEKAAEAKANEVSEEKEKPTEKKENEPSDEKVNGVSAEKTVPEKEKEPTSDSKTDGVSEEKKVPEEKEKEPGYGKDEGKRVQKKVRTDGGVETVEDTTSKAEDKKQAAEAKKNMVKRTKTRVLDFTLSLRPTYHDDDADKEEYNKDSLGRFKKANKKLMSLILVIILLAVALWLYAKKSAFSWSSSLLGGSKFQEL